MIKNIWLCCILSIYSCAVYSIPYEMVVHSSDKYLDYMSIESWDVDDPSPNPMRYQSKGDDNLYFVYSEHGTSGFHPPEQFYVPGARNAKTMGDLGKLFIKAGFIGKRINGLRISSPGRRSCWKFGYQYINMNGSWNVMPFDNTCVYGEFPPNICWIDKPSIEIDHGILTTREVNGNTAYTEFYVSCSAAMSIYVVSPTGESSVVLSQANGLRSDIMVNNNKLGDGARISASTSPTRVRISSTLSGYNSQGTGTFAGSLTIVLSKD